MRFVNQSEQIPLFSKFLSTSQRTAAPRVFQCAISVQFGWIWLHPVDSVDEIPP